MRISFFHTPKPRQFEYKPRFYDPEKEELENLKKKYASVKDGSAENETLEYYKRRIRLMEFEKKSNNSLGSFFSKKEIPKFNYQPRFYNTDTIQTETPAERKDISFKRSQFYDNKLFAERIPLTRIIIFVAICLLLLIWIFY